MKVLTCSRTFPAGHPRKGQPTFFVEKIWNALINLESTCDTQTMMEYLQWGNHEWWEISKVYDVQPKHHTIRAGSRFKPGDMVSLRVWSGAPYRSKQIEFAQVEVKKVWPVEIYVGELIVEIIVDNISQNIRKKKEVALNDGLELIDFVNWFKIHPKAKKGISFKGQIICWNESIEYNK